MEPNPLAVDLDHVLKHTHKLWDDLRGERIFITGGTGFFGCWLLESFAWANNILSLGAQAVVLTRSPQAFQKKAPHLAADESISLWNGDIRDFEFPPGNFVYIIHAATEASASLNETNPLEMLDVNITGTRRVLDFAVQQPLKGFLYTSSGAVYGRQPPELSHLPETSPCTVDPTNPRNAYAVGKIAGEHLCALFLKQNNAPIKIARCFAFVGPYLPLDIHFAIGNFIRDALREEPILVKGDGAPYRSYLYAADLAIWLLTILFRGQAGQTYNVGAEDDLSIAELARLVASACLPEVEVKILGAPDLTKLVQRYVPSTQRAESELELHTWIPLSESIQRTIRYHKMSR